MKLLTFQSGDAIVKIKIEGKSIFYTNANFNFSKFYPIELLFNPDGILKENPDLEGKPKKEIMDEGIKRWKKHIASIKSEDEIVNYVEDEMLKDGLQLIHIGDEHEK